MPAGSARIHELSFTNGDCIDSVASRVVNQVKNRLAALSMLDRAFRLLADDRIGTLYEALDDEGQGAIRHIASVQGEASTPDVIAAVRVTATKGRINGDLERLAITLTEKCLDECIEALGSNADDPSEDNLRSVLPDIISEHGLDVTQVMLATVVTGEALASPIITRLLKHDDAWKLPPAPAVEVAPIAKATKQDDAERQAIKEQRKARKLAEQEAARRRREQSATARRR